MILPGQERAATVAINSYGESCSITRPVDSDNSRNRYGKTSAESFEEIATEPVVRIYQRGTRPQQNRVTGGEHRMDSPVLLFISDSAIAEGYRVSYQTSLYEVDSLTDYPTHLEAKTTVIG